MNKKEATDILIRHAAANVVGVGCGIRGGTSREERALVIEAIKTLWPTVHGFACGANELRNLGL